MMFDEFGVIARKTFHFMQGAPMFVEGAHNGTIASPSL